MTGDNVTVKRASRDVTLMVAWFRRIAASNQTDDRGKSRVSGWR